MATMEVPASSFYVETLRLLHVQLLPGLVVNWSPSRRPLGDEVNLLNTLLMDP